MSGGHKRCEGWEQKLDALIEGKRKAPFKWGTHDCMTFASEIVQTIGVPVDVIANHRGKYKDTKTAAKIIKENGGMKKFACHLFEQFPQISLHSAKRGDVVLLEVDKNLVMGVCVGMEAAALSEKGLEFVSIKDHGKIVWAIGHK